MKLNGITQPDHSPWKDAATWKGKLCHWAWCDPTLVLLAVIAILMVLQVVVSLLGGVA